MFGCSTAILTLVTLGVSKTGHATSGLLCLGQLSVQDAQLYSKLRGTEPEAEFISGAVTVRLIVLRQSRPFSELVTPHW